MRTDTSSGTIVRASLLGLLAMVVFGGLLLLVETAILLAEGGEVGLGLSRFSRDVAPWVFLAAGVVAGLYLRSLLLLPVLQTSVLTNLYFFVLSLLFHAFVGLTLVVLLVQLQTFLLGLVVFGVALALGALAEREKERAALHE